MENVDTFVSSLLIKSGHQRFRDCDPIFVGAGAVMVCAGLSIFVNISVWL